MAFWNRKKKRTLEVKALGVTGDPLREFLLYGASTAHSSESAINLYEESSAVSIPINRIARLFSGLDPVLEINGKKIINHPLINLLNKPCPEFSKELFMQALATYYLITGESFALLFGNVIQPPKQIYPISPSGVSHHEARGMIEYFEIVGQLYPSKYINNDGVYISSDKLKQLIQIRDFNVRGNSILRGKSRLIAASNSARQQVLGVKHNLSILEKGGRLSLIFHFENDLNADEFAAIKESVLNQFSGPGNAGNILVTAGGRLSVDNPGMTNMDMDWANSMRTAMDTLLLTYDLPLSLFSLEASTMDNYRTGLEAIYDDAIIPLSKVIYGNLASILFPRFNVPDGAKLTFDKDQVTALVMRRNNEVKLRKDIDVETDNELRGMLGREAYDGGDIKYKASGLIPIGSDILTEDDDIDDTGLEDD
jgi:phage portal protein BeeE